ncbi:hypothetical protein ACFTS5_14925 [Nocardia sp. NPDC056952]|uniref:hypothetical protein n=1 Tax=Nocardia sp. NPDC056952 TaxID=3345979 RepID=UPI003641545E
MGGSVTWATLRVNHDRSHSRGSVPASRRAPSIERAGLVQIRRDEALTTTFIARLPYREEGTMAFLIPLFVAFLLVTAAVVLASYATVSLTYWFESRRIRPEQSDPQPAR